MEERNNSNLQNYISRIGIMINYHEERKKDRIEISEKNKERLNEMASGLITEMRKAGIDYNSLNKPKIIWRTHELTGRNESERMERLKRRYHNYYD